MDYFTKTKEKLHIFAQITTFWPNFCLPSLSCTRKVQNVFNIVWKWDMFFSQGHGGNCHYMSNVIFGMMQGNNAFKHFHFLTLGYRFYLGLFAWSSQHNFTGYHWQSIITIPSSFCDHFVYKVVIKNVKLSSWSYNIQKFWFMLRWLCMESFILIIHSHEKISGVNVFSICDKGINLKF